MLPRRGPVDSSCDHLDPNAGLLCALGLLVEPLRLDLVRTRMQRLEAPAMPEISQALRELETEAVAWLEREAVPPKRCRFIPALDMRT